MALTSYKLFHELIILADNDCTKAGFDCKYSEINELNSRFRLAKSFQGVNLANYTEKTSAGYDAFFQVFLTHSVLERFMYIWKIKNINQLDLMLDEYNPEFLAREFVMEDTKQRLYEFLYKNVNDRLKQQLSHVYEGKSKNVFQISASIRHIFAHGILTANANGINPKKVKKMCNKLSEFTLNFIDSEFTKRVEQNN